MSRTNRTVFLCTILQDLISLGVSTSISLPVAVTTTCMHPTVLVVCATGVWERQTVGAVFHKRERLAQCRTIWLHAPTTSLDCPVGIGSERLQSYREGNDVRRMSHRYGEATSLESFRHAVREAARKAGEPHRVLSYARATIGQTGSGHVSPRGG